MRKTRGTAHLKLCVSLSWFRKLTECWLTAYDLFQDASSSKKIHIYEGIEDIEMHILNASTDLEKIEAKVNPVLTLS